MTIWCDAWPEELKEVERRRYRAECRLRCLTSALDRVDPVEFAALMAQIERARDEYRIAVDEKLGLMLKQR